MVDSILRIVDCKGECCRNEGDLDLCNVDKTPTSQ
jgi:hypothetical protein